MRRLIPAVASAMLSLFIPLATAAQEAGLVSKLHAAVAVGNVTAARQMLSQDPALARSTARFDFQPMHLQDLYFNPAILDLLLDNGADINAANDEGITLLHIIADPDAVPLLLEKGADIEARDKAGWTPLMRQITAQEDGPNVVLALMKAGANRNAHSDRGLTALDLVLEGGADPALVRRLLGR